MALASVPVTVDKKQQQAIVNYTINCVETLATLWNVRAQFLQRDLIYARQVDYSIIQNRSLTANLTGDPTKLQNPVIPIVMPQVESALAYNAGVFLTGYPIFGVASNPTNADVALQLETVIADNSMKYGWVRQLIMFLRDSLKFNIAFLECQWKQERIYSLNLDPAQNLGRGATGKSEQYYQGNYLERWDPYNTIWDKRVLNPVELPKKGEFVGKTEVMGRVQLKQLLLDLNRQYTMNAREAFESGVPAITLNGADSWYYIPQVNPQSFIAGQSSLMTTNWLAWAMLDGGKNKDGITYNNMYEVTTLYARIIPQDFLLSVPARNQPQIWKFIVVNRRILIYVERQTNAHNLLPVMVAQINEDGLGYQTLSFQDNAAPFQQMATGLWTGAMEAKRRQVFDRIFYDPSRIRKEDIDKVGAVGRIPVKQAHYGKSIQEAVYAFPYHDEGIASTVQMAENMNAMADIANGQNKVQRGQFQKGNKTKQEFDVTMMGASSRQQLQALGIEHQVMTPLKEMIKINILQYQPDAKLYNVANKAEVDVSSDDLRKSVMNFQISDGLLPTDKILSTDILQVFMQTLQTSPLMQSEFDIVGAFAYWCKMNGAQWFNDFKRTPEQQQATMQQLTAHEQAKKGPPQQGAQPAPATPVPGAQ